MADNEDVNTLKRRGRRRLVGAIALVLAAVIVLPMVFDSEPKGTPPPVSVRIPSEDESGFTPKVTPKAPPEKPAAEKPVEKKVEAQVEKPVEKAVEKAIGKEAEKKAEKPPVSPEAERARAEAALADAQFIFPVGAYADPGGVIDKLKSAKIPFYTEALAVKGGKVTRVRAGPFPTREAAEKALKQLKDLGLKPGNVAAKS